MAPIDYGIEYCFHLQFASLPSYLIREPLGLIVHMAAQLNSTVPASFAAGCDHAEPSVMKCEGSDMFNFL